MPDELAAAIQSQINNAVATAMLGDDVLRQFVLSALNSEVDDPAKGYRAKSPYLHVAIREAIQNATHRAIYELLEKESNHIKDLVKSALLSNTDGIADEMVKSMVSYMKDGVGLRITVNLDIDK